MTPASVLVLFLNFALSLNSHISQYETCCQAAVALQYKNLMEKDPRALSQESDRRFGLSPFGDLSALPAPTGYAGFDVGSLTMAKQVIRVEILSERVPDLLGVIVRGIH